MTLQDGYDRCTMAQIYSRGGRSAIEETLTSYARQCTWAELIHAEDMAVAVMEEAKSSLVARHDQLEAETAQQRSKLARLAEVESVPADFLRPVSAILDRLEAEVEELSKEIDRRDAEIESVCCASLGRFDEDPESGNVPLR
ncbi:hypothetical protein ACFVU3_28875 [Streptomyces sp. NPDC058052]|uniref:hypothetical protein n=1 Tax=Streptomyces sp. NPDC058052 TaxID=3346316 RepID=UPI0036E779F4